MITDKTSVQKNIMVDKCVKHNMVSQSHADSKEQKLKTIKLLQRTYKLYKFRHPLHKKILNKKHTCL